MAAVVAPHWFFTRIDVLLQCNALYENLYLMGTSLARPCIAKAAVSGE